MQSPIQRNLEQISRLCREHKVRRFAVFGSAARADFNPAVSDFDFLVEFELVPIADRMRHLIELRAALAALLSRPVDLVEEGAIRNPYILQNISEEQQLLYAA
jgi:predicted nucleotidyltransferase